MPDLYFENEHTKKRYRVVSRDTEAGTVTLVGPHGVPFTEKFTVERFKQMGYKPVVDDGPPAPPAAAAPPPPGAAAAPPPPPAGLVVGG